MASKQVSEVALGDVSRHGAGPSHKRARVSTYADKSRSSDGDRSRTTCGGSENLADDFLPAWQSTLPRASGGRNSLPPVAELPSDRPAGKAGGGSYRGDRDRDRDRNGDRRSASPTPSYASSSTLSAATTTATALSSRASLSSCRSSFTSSSSSCSWSGGGRGRYNSRAGHRDSSSSSSSSSKGFFSSSVASGSSRSSYSSSSRQASAAASRGGGGGGGSGADFFPKPSSSWSGGVNRRRRGSPGADRRRDGSRDRYPGNSSSGGGGSSRGSRDRHYGCPPLGRRSGDGHKDYASEAGSTGSGSGGRKRNRSRSRERGRGSSSSCSSRRSRSAAESSSFGVECARCLEWCRYSRAQQRKPITRTLQMDYYVRTPGCKAAKSKHIDFIDDVAYSREQFIEETVFTCPFTGSRRDIVLERNMFPYDVPTDVEHWTLWSREDLSEAEMEAFVQAWAAENHPHVVEWECDNNEGERSIDWFHVHVFFRLGCEDRTGVPRDPASVYDGPYRPKDEEAEEEEEVGDAAAAAAAPAAGGGEGGGGGAGDGGKREEGEHEEEEAVTDHE